MSYLNTIQIQNDESAMKEEYKIKSLYLAKCAHEIKNILISIISFIENSKITIEPYLNVYNNYHNNSNKKRETLSPESSKFFLKSLCDFGMSLILDINRLSKEETKRSNFQEEKNEKFNIVEALNFCVQMFESRCLFEKKNIKIKTSFKIPNNKIINSINQVKFKQVIINLLSNSYKFTIKGYIKVSAEKNNNKIKITISDTGVGFEDGEMEDFNMPFHLIKNNQYLNKNGSGLGLCITKEILNNCGSELKFESKKGIGSKFWFEIDDSNIIIDPTLILSKNFKDLINDINHGIKDKNQTIKTIKTGFFSEKTESDFSNIKFVKDSNLKENSYKTLQLHKRKKHSSNLMIGKNSEILSKNNKLFITKNMLDYRMRNLTSTLCPRAFTLSNDFKTVNNTAILLNNSLKTYKILICDDDRLTALSTQNSILKYFKQNNNKSPPDILFAQNGIECLYVIYSNFIKENAVHLLLIDKHMPFIDGVTTCTLLKNIIELNDIKIYMLSSDVEMNECKIDGFFEKPISNNAIQEIVKILYEE